MCAAEHNFLWNTSAGFPDEFGRVVDFKQNTETDQFGFCFEVSIFTHNTAKMCSDFWISLAVLVMDLTKNAAKIRLDFLHCSTCEFNAIHCRWDFYKLGRLVNFRTVTDNIYILYI